jgi:hypothetical protein
MAIRGKGVLAIWMDPDPAIEEEFNAWYPRQHLPERLGVPGFLRGRRYFTTGTPPEYFTLYETETVEVLSSAAYLERLNHPTDWTRRVLPGLRQMIRSAYRFVGAVEEEEGKYLGTMRITPVPGQEEDLTRRYTNEVLRALAEVPGVRSSYFFRAETADPSVVTEERKLVGNVLAPPAFLCTCELADPAVVEQSRWKNLWAPGGLACRGIATTVAENVYRLMYGLAWL